MLEILFWEFVSSKTIVPDSQFGNEAVPKMQFGKKKVPKMQDTPGFYGL